MVWRGQVKQSGEISILRECNHFSVSQPGFVPWKVGLAGDLIALNAGEMEAWGRIYDRSFDPLLGYALKRFGGQFSREDCEDVVEEVMLGLYESVNDKNWHSDQQAAGYLFKMVKNRMIDLARFQKRHPQLELDVEQEDYDQGWILQDNLLSYGETLQRLMTILTVQERRLVLCILAHAYGEKISKQELAEEIGVHPSRITQLLASIRNKAERYFPDK